MQFYKHRDFGILINDSIMFFKQNWKNYFQNYFLINGLIFILLVLLFVFGYRELLSQIFNTGIGSESYFLEEYFLQNQGMLITVTCLIFVLFIALMVVSYSFPVLYMKRMSETGVKQISTDTILEDMKANLRKYFKLFLGLFLVVFPAATILFLFSYVLLFIGIGFFLLILVMPMITNMINFLVFDYFHREKGFFASLRYAFKAQFSYSKNIGKKPFWKYWGSAAVIYFIIQTATTIFTMIPTVIFVIVGIVIPESKGQTSSDIFSLGMVSLMLIIYIVSISVSLIFSNLQYVNAGFMYYDSRLDLHREVDLNEIDTIGSNED